MKRGCGGGRCIRKVDRISDLPLNIIDNILARLPIRDAVRTSILSKKWKYRWVSLPELVFDCSLQDALKNEHDMIVKFIDRVLLLHIGPIHKFELSDLSSPSLSDIHQWLLFVSRNGIKELILSMPPCRWYEVPSCLFSSFHQLNHLELSHCSLRCPTKLEFKHIKCLSLCQVEFVGFTFEDLVSSCPLLETLTLMWVRGFTNLVMDAPKLKYLHLRGHFKDIHFKNTPILAKVEIDLDWFGSDLHWEETCNLIKVLGGLVGVEDLCMASGGILKFLAVGIVPKMLPNACYDLKFCNLKRLRLTSVAFHDSGVVSVALYLIRSAPNLQKLEISGSTRKDTDVKPVIELLELQDGLGCSFNQLQNVTMKCSFGLRPELEFIKFLLTVSPVLEKMSIHSDSKDMDTEEQPNLGSTILEEVMQFPRLSSKAEIECFEHLQIVDYRPSSWM
ncbi:F-box/FBD/LRR-repeat protein At1g13570-like [Telopea speciosissima]|uniref:F-box/FBD/LRR-repeat protein At1g13570-like n=1 Tax=Telopea speciosissima TaxID=54955 RepID=UPI001CC7CDE8|nr:F-box/FBD/LRR-repeat protein At1g13570-like [Telopea speciosissima]